MALRNTYNIRLIMTILAASMMVVALACRGEAATPTSPPTAAATVAATATPVPTALVRPDQAQDWVNYLLSHPGYQKKWGTPQYGGVFKAGTPAAPARAELFFGWSAFPRADFAAHNSLLMMDQWLEIDAPVMCDLCESFTVSADGKTITFKLREGVKFHSEGWGKDKGAPGFGSEMVCEDVKHSMEWIANPPEGIAFAGTIANAKAYLKNFDSVTCPDGPQGYTAVMKFKYFRNPTLGWLAVGFKIWDKEYREWLDAEYPGIQATGKEESWLSDMGTGSQIWTYANPDTVMKTRTNPNYFKKGAPFIDGLEWYNMTDYNVKFASWITGKIHFAGHGSSGLTKAQVIQVQRDYPDYKLHMVRYNHIQYLRMNPLRPPFDSWKVRWAVQLAWDRQEWIDFNQAGAIPMSNPNFYLHPDALYGIPYEEYKNYPGWRLDKKDEDLAEANRLLDEAFGKGIRPKLEYPIFTTLVSRREPGLWLLDKFKTQLNWSLDPTFIETPEFVKRITTCDYILMVDAKPPHGQTYLADPSDAFVMAHSKWTTTIWGPCEVNAWKGVDEGGDLQTELDRIDKLIEELDTSQDPVRRQEISQYLEKYMIQERTTAAVLGHMNVAWGMRPEVGGDHFYHLGNYSQQRLIDYWWLNK